YGGKPFVDGTGKTIIARQALHACILGIHHPITGQKMEFTAPLRGDMAQLVAALRTTHRVERPVTPGATVDMEKAVGG
ncbi:MAG TPA: hypothetical protein VK176_03960, partial [Phycisphaerales bacterium]|nr:hypothetical protein [Phycisphaerales bacterium]